MQYAELLLRYYVFLLQHMLPVWISKKVEIWFAHGPVMYEDPKSAKILVLGDLVPEIMPKNRFRAIFGFFSKPCEIQMVKAMRLIFWPMIELKTRFDLSHQLVSYLATRWLSARSWENLWSRIRPCSTVLQKNFIKSKTSGITYIFW